MWESDLNPYSQAALAWFVFHWKSRIKLIRYIFRADWLEVVMQT